MDTNNVPDKKFTISIPESEYNQVISKSKSIVIVKEYKCSCYFKNPRAPDHFVLMKSATNPLTNKRVIDMLTAKNFNPNCSHKNVKGFQEASKDVFHIICSI